MIRKVKRKKYNKLVRDKIPQLIRQRGGIPIVRVADKAEYWEKLKEKLLEEAQEFITSEAPEELADILEVIDAIADFKGFSQKELRTLKTKKSTSAEASLNKSSLKNHRP